MFFIHPLHNKQGFLQTFNRYDNKLEGFFYSINQDANDEKLSWMAKINYVRVAYTVLYMFAYLNASFSVSRFVGTCGQCEA